MRTPCGTIAAINGAIIVVIAVDGIMRASINFVASICRTGIVIIAIKWIMRTAKRRITTIYSACVVIIAVDRVIMACHPIAIVRGAGIVVVAGVDAKEHNPVATAGTGRHVPVLDRVATFYAGPAAILIKAAGTRRNRARVLSHTTAAPAKPFIIGRAAAR
jgi:hypothetical protein